MIARDAPVSLQFNHGQCRFLVKNLERAVHSARVSMSSPRDSSEVDVKDWKFIGKWKFLVWLALDVQRFVQECFKENNWIQAASVTLVNAFEHVNSLYSHLELCIWSFKKSGRIIFETTLRRELISISKAHDWMTGELDNLLRKVRVTSKLESLRKSEGDKLAASLLGELIAALAINPVTIDQRTSLAELSVHDHVDLLKRVAAFSPGSLSDSEEQIATSLAPRFLVSAVDPFSENTDIDFMGVDCASLSQEGELGNGNFGTVYRVQWLGIPAAQKVSIGMRFWPVFVNEVSISARQSHPNIVQLLCYVKDVPNKDDPNANQSPNEDEHNEDDPNEDEPTEDDSKFSMLQELMQKDLRGLIEERMKFSDGASESKQKFPCSMDKVVDILLQIAEGMAYLHQRRVLHRDLKSQNILVKCEKHEEIGSEYIVAKVADFGISKTREKTITRSHPTKNVGTSRWMAPEVIKIRYIRTGNVAGGDGDPFWNHCKCDVYSFGIVSYEVLTREQPFVSYEEIVAKEKVLAGEQPPLPREHPFCLRSMFNKCWRGEPKERPTFAEIGN